MKKMRKQKVLDDEVTTIFQLMQEAGKPDSKWKPYFDVLPKTFTTPYYFTGELS